MVPQKKNVFTSLSLSPLRILFDISYTWLYFSKTRTRTHTSKRKIYTCAHRKYTHTRTHKDINVLFIHRYAFFLYIYFILYGKRDSTVLYFSHIFSAHIYIHVHIHISTEEFAPLSLPRPINAGEKKR